jgi:uncharacterized phage-associated protein
MASAQDAAWLFIDYANKRGEPMTNERLNLLLYFAQGVYFARTGECLFPEDFEAWGDKEA